MTDTNKAYPIVRASGTCIACDFKVRDEIVLLIAPPEGLRTRAFVLELRHLEDETYARLRPDGWTSSTDGGERLTRVPAYAPR